MAESDFAPEVFAAFTEKQQERINAEDLKPADIERMRKESLESMMTAATITSLFLDARSFCFEGVLAKRLIKEAAEGEINPDPGEYCLGLLRHSASTETDPSILKDHPEQGLLEPYKAMLIDKNVTLNLEEDKSTLATRLANAAFNEHKAATTMVEVPIGDREFQLTQGLALDSAFSSIIDDYRKGTIPKPALNYTAEELASATNACFYNYNGVTMETCARVGVAQAALAIDDLEIKAAMVPNFEGGKPEKTKMAQLP